VGTGVALIGAGVLLTPFAVLAMRREPTRLVALALLAVAGAAVGAGALLVQGDASRAEWAITLVALGSLTPAHAWLVFRRPRRSE
jgi:uncharacterized membrane protein YfcA